MQTFLPLEDFRESAATLDLKRLGKQRVEVLQLLHALTRPGHGWRHHPAARMWRGYQGALAAYGVVICEAWRAHGYRDRCLDQIRAYTTETVDMPWWLGDPSFHASHRSNLLRKKPEHYGRFGWVEPPDLPYVWPRLPDA